MTVLMTTHHMEEADLYCDRVALMHHGTLRATGTPAELKAELGAGGHAGRRVPPLHRRDAGRRHRKGRHP